MKRVHITWVDSSGPVHGGWQPLDDERRSEPCIVDTVGFELVRDECYTTIVSSYCDETDTGTGFITIPTVAIMKRKVLR